MLYLPLPVIKHPQISIYKGGEKVCMLNTHIHTLKQNYIMVLFMRQISKCALYIHIYRHTQSYVYIYIPMCIYTQIHIYTHTQTLRYVCVHA